MKRKEWKEYLRFWYHFAFKSANWIEITMQIENIHYCKQSLQEENIVTRAESHRNVDKALTTQFHDSEIIEICQNINMNREHILVWVVSTRILVMLWSKYIRENINTTTKSKYTRVSRLVSSRDKSHEQIYRLKSWQYFSSKICASFDEFILYNFSWCRALVNNVE